MMDIFLFEILTPLGVIVRSTENYWRYIVEIKHPSMANKLDEIKKALQYPDEIRQSIKDETVFLFYKKAVYDRWHCAVIKKPNSHGFLVTAYVTDRIKEGRVIWKP